MATFGVTADNTNTTISSADRKRVSSASPSSNGTVTSLTCRCWQSAAESSSVRGIIYSDSAGNPDTLLAVTDTGTVSNIIEQANTFNFTGANQISITAGTTYWIGLHWSDPGGGNFTISCNFTAGGNKNSADTFSDGTATSFGAITSSTGVIDCYVTYTEAGASGVSRLLILGTG